MEAILFAFIGAMCLMLGVRVFCAEEQNKIFTKYPIQVTDVKKYNQACGILIIGFGIVAEITLYFMISSEGLLSTLFTLGIIIEALITMVIYRQIEKKFRKTK
ncbi:MAG: hypothetical protein J6A94_09335 [Lachnospiraceae bacterium]|nr:hypothetical protein [Lachnospiraceae bacterium]